METEPGQKKHLFTNKQLWALLVPVVVEQILNSLMGTADTMMVSNVGSAAISAVSLVDSINVLVIQVFAALAAGGTIICSQYMGQKNTKNATDAAKQLIFIITAIAVVLTVVCVVFQIPLLHLIFGKVEAEVMTNSEVYFLYTALSFPFIAVFNAGSSVFRAQENTRLPMTISVISNIMNIVGNAILIFGFHMGVAGAALSTLISRIFCAIVVMYFLRSPKEEICVRDYTKIRPDRHKIKMILALGIPTGIENGMFQFGKLAIQSTVSTLGTAAIAAQAMTNILENLNGIAAIGIGIGLMNVVGECIGAGRKDEAIYYTKKMCLVSEVVIIISCLLVFALTKPIIHLGGMSAESGRMCFFMVTWITIIKPIVWVPAFIPAYSMRAAGDVKFSMILSCTTMWLCRVTLCVVLCRVFGFGPIAVWIGMFSDWTLRGIFYTLRFHGKKWLDHKVIE